MTTLGDDLARHCERLDGEFSTNPTQVKASCSIGDSKIVMNDHRGETGFRVEKEGSMTKVKGRIQDSNENLEVQSDPDFVAGQSILQVKNAEGESIEIIKDGGKE